MERALATVVNVQLENIREHPHADRLSIARVGGWDVVVQTPSADTLGVFFETDSIIPPHILPDRGLTVKTRKIRDVLSQGLFLPFNELPPDITTEGWHVGQDVTSALQVDQVRTVDDIGQSSSAPGFYDIAPVGVQKTHEFRVQSKMKLLDQLKGKPYYMSLKYDGSSSTFVLDDGNLTVLSRNLEAGPGSIYTRAADIYRLRDKSAGKRVVLQGEVYGPGVNGNKHEMDSLRLAIFNVFDIKTAKYLDLDSMLAVLADLDVPAVHIVERGESFQHNQDNLLAAARGNFYNTETPREGLVVRSIDQSCSFKVLNIPYSLQFD